MPPKKLRSLTHDLDTVSPIQSSLACDNNRDVPENWSEPGRRESVSLAPSSAENSAIPENSARAVFDGIPASCKEVPIAPKYL
jgi:hypothetical protein